MAGRPPRLSSPVSLHDNKNLCIVELNISRECNRKSVSSHCPRFVVSRPSLMQASLPIRKADLDLAVPLFYLIRTLCAA